MEHFYPLVKNIKVHNIPKSCADILASVFVFLDRQPIRTSISFNHYQFVALDVGDSVSNRGCSLILYQPVGDWEDTIKYSLEGPCGDEVSIKSAYDQWLYSTNTLPTRRFLALVRAHLLFHLTSLTHQIEAIEHCMLQTGMPYASVVCVENTWSNIMCSYQSELEREYAKLGDPLSTSCFPAIDAVRNILQAICSLFPESIRTQEVGIGDYAKNLQMLRHLSADPYSFLCSHVDDFNSKIDEQLHKLADLSHYFASLKQCVNAHVVSDKVAEWSPSRADALRLHLNTKAIELIKKNGLLYAHTIPRAVLVYEPNPDIFSSICYTSRRNEQLRSLLGFVSDRLTLRWSCNDMRTFSASLFHNNCDRIRNIFIVIEERESRYIFGGYSDRGWGAEESSLDVGAFVFSLTNPGRTPFRIMTTDPILATSVDCDSVPSFGRGELRLLVGGWASIGRLESFAARDDTRPHDASSFIKNAKGDKPFRIRRIEGFEKN